MQGNFALAEPLQKESYEASVAKYGPNHPTTLTNENNLAFLYSDFDRYDEAKALFTRNIEKRRVRYGDKHPKTLDSMMDCGSLCLTMKHYADAISWFEFCYVTRLAILGADDANTRLSKDRLDEATKEAAES